MAPIFDKLFKGKAAAANPAATPTPEQYEAFLAQATSAAAARAFQQAIALCDRAIAADPSRAEGYYKRANALKDLGQLDAAITGYNQAIERKPDYAYAYCNRGFVEHRKGCVDAALKSFDRAIELDPDDAFPHYNRAMALQDCQRWNEAIASYDRAIAANPEFADAQFNRAMALLYTGDFASGWPAWEWRWKNAQRLGIGEERHFRQPLWLGDEPLGGKRLLIHSEQGLGDTLQFCRYAALCAQRGATVILEVQPALSELLADLDGVTELIPKGELLPAFDYHCPIMTLPLAFRTTLDTIPAPASYLRSDPTRVAHWQSTLGERNGARVGLVWSGNARNYIDQRRSIRLADWIRHLPAQYQYYQLQTQVRPEDEAALDATECLFSFEDELLDFANTAALCDCMDLVISVDTSLAHLSGALGRRTWMPLAHTPDWRWMRERPDTPWYPQTRLYRQTQAGDWRPVFERIASDLRKEFPAR
ncbi:MAG TPA: tetratricopeptide repeat protein [Steroidobacteraceae bacterium]|nr:tetratricopeptide repeat protein [Steroidobacteraceae bacterium]